MKKKKIITIIVVLGLITLSLFGCSHKDGKDVIDNPDPITEEENDDIVMGDPEKAKELEKYVADYQKLDESIDYEQLNIDDPYCLARVLVMGDPVTEGFDIIGMAKDSYGATVVQLKNSSDVESFIQTQKDHGLNAEADNIVIGDFTNVNQEIRSSANPISWGTSYIHADEMAAYLNWKKLNKRQIIVAVVDSGVDIDHQMLKNRLIQGFDFVNYTNTPQDEHGHGSHVSGIIVDSTENLNVKILPIKVFEITTNKKGEKIPYAPSSRVRMAIYQAVESGAAVINLSLGSKECVNYIDTAIDYAISKGVTVVTSSGNDYGRAEQNCPAHIMNAGLIVVGAIREDEKLASFSNIGSSVDLVAPGFNINSCNYNGSFINKNGTSMAAPYVSAAAAMLKLLDPSLSPAAIESKLKSAAKDLGVVGRDDAYGAGALDLSSFIDVQVINFKFTQLPNKLTYYPSGKMDFTGAIVEIEYNNATYEIKPFAEVSDAVIKFYKDEKEITSFDELGKVRVEVVYQGIKASFEINIIEAPEVVFPELDNLSPISDFNFRITYHPGYAEGSCDILGTNGHFEVDYSEYGVTYNKETNTVTLDHTQSGYLCATGAGNGLKIEVIGDCNLNMLSLYSCAYGGSVTITGNGSLTIRDTKNESYGFLQMVGSMTPCCLMVDSNVRLEVENRIEIFTTTLKDAVLYEKGLSLTGDISIVEDPDGTSFPWGDWHLEEYLKNHPEKKTMMYHLLISPVNGSIVIGK